MLKYILILLLLVPSLLQAQTKQKYPVYGSPVEFPIYLSGTFAELRSNHFHSGIDIRTQGVEGQKVLSIGDGFVSRIAVSPTGFGYALYINHPEGYTSVYGHLQRFNKEIAAFVKAEQYKQKSFKIDVELKAGQFPVKKGQVIALSGNSGSSGGAHLHFEIREAASQEPMNPLYFGMKIKDFVRPAISMLAVYPFNEKSTVNKRGEAAFIPVEGWGEQHRLSKHQTIHASGKISFGISVIDKHNDVPNSNGIFSLRLLVDSLETFKYTADRFSFSESRYINSMIDYRYYIEHQKRLIRTEVDPYNKLRIYENREGILDLKPGRTYKAVFEVVDFNGNRSLLPFSIIADTIQLKAGKKENKANVFIAKASEEARLIKPGFYASIPADAFYKDEELLVNTTQSTDSLQPEIQFGDPGIPVHKSITLGIQPPKNATRIEKMYVALYDKNGKETSYVGGRYQDGFVEASVRNLGKFTLRIDTIRPKIRAVNFKNGAAISALKEIRVIIQDLESGIDGYEATLNGKWLLMAYDAKNHLLTYEIDERMQKGKNIFKLEVIDNKGNKSVFETTLTR